MALPFDVTKLFEIGIDNSIASNLCQIFQDNMTPNDYWQQLRLNESFLSLPYPKQLAIFKLLHPEWPVRLESGIAWKPSHRQITESNLYALMQTLTLPNLASLHALSIEQPDRFWGKILERLGIQFSAPPTQISDLSGNVKQPDWLPHAKFNIAANCFHAAPDKVALIYPNHAALLTMTYGELDAYSNQIANSLVNQGCKPGDAIGIVMTMTPAAVAIYLAIIKMGGIVVSIADSFSGDEIALRLQIANAKAVFTQEHVTWGGKQFALYEKVKTYSAAKIIVVAEGSSNAPLRDSDVRWKDFLLEDSQFTPVACDPMQACQILFSSGTTGEPKAIVWNHTTPLKAASDAHLHHNIQPSDRLAWPTNLGWMMGPWLVYAGLINQAAIALYPDAPKNRDFGHFIEQAGVTMLGVVPTLVATWRDTQCMQGLNWSQIKSFSSTGECSNPEDMFYLMSLAQYKPVIEYCGGTEIGGAYISSTVIEPNCPSVFTTPTMGSDFVILSDDGQIAEQGEVAIIPPAIGLSTKLLNANHDAVYYQNMPILPNGKLLRRHGDQITRLDGGGFSILGRVDDTMNMGGIKVSAAEIERVLMSVDGVLELAAVAVPPPHNGPSLLVIYCSSHAMLDKQAIQSAMQKQLNQQLNPLFRIHDVILTNDLPKTASNKIMRRALRTRYIESQK